MSKIDTSQLSYRVVNTADEMGFMVTYRGKDIGGASSLRRQSYAKRVAWPTTSVRRYQEYAGYAQVSIDGIKSGYDTRLIKACQAIDRKLKKAAK